VFQFINTVCTESFDAPHPTRRRDRAYCASTVRKRPTPGRYYFPWVPRTADAMFLIGMWGTTKSGRMQRRSNATVFMN